jgi:hypothetical protein
MVQSSWSGAVHVQSSSPGFTHSANAAGEAVSKAVTVNNSPMARMTSLLRAESVSALCDH